MRSFFTNSKIIVVLVIINIIAAFATELFILLTPTAPMEFLLEASSCATEDEIISRLGSPLHIITAEYDGNIAVPATIRREIANGGSLLLYKRIYPPTNFFILIDSKGIRKRISYYVD